MEIVKYTYETEKFVVKVISIFTYDGTKQIREEIEVQSKITGFGVRVEEDGDVRF